MTLTELDQALFAPEFVVEADREYEALKNASGTPFAGRYDHLVLDLRVVKIPSADEVERWARSMLPKHGIRVLSSASHEFDSPVPGFAYTLLLVLSASHMAVHTAPEHHWIQVVFSLCDGRDRRSALEQEAADFFRPERIDVSSLSTGANWI